MSWFTVLRLLLYRSVLELFSKSFKVFHCSVINVRCCYFQQLVYFIISSSRCQQLFYFSLLSSVWHLRFSGVSHATAIIDYHNFNSLSIIILIFFATHFWVILLSYDSLSRLSHSNLIVNSFFIIFRNFYISFEPNAKRQDATGNYSWMPCLPEVHCKF